MKNISQVDAEIQAHEARYQNTNGFKLKELGAARVRARFLQDAKLALAAGCNEARIGRNKELASKKLAQFRKLLAQIMESKNDKQIKKQLKSELNKSERPNVTKRQIALCNYLLESE